MALTLSKLDHSRLVAFSKRALLGLMGVLMLALVVFSWMNQRGGGRLVLESAPQGEVATAKPSMVKPYYQGVDARNRPFNIAAATAMDEGNKIYRLNKVNANLAANTPDWASLSSALALYYSAEERIELSGGVEVTNDAGYLFTTPKATLSIKDSTAKGDEVVEGTGAGGTLRANRFEIVDGGNRIMFYGDVHVTIYRKNAQ
jgi:lipopolysaccharide export system protein LptC